MTHGWAQRAHNYLEARNKGLPLQGHLWGIPECWFWMRQHLHWTLTASRYRTTRLFRSAVFCSILIYCCYSLLSSTNRPKDGNSKWQWEIPVLQLNLQFHKPLPNKLHPVILPNSPSHLPGNLQDMSKNNQFN